jgi:hypothetical protein
MTDTNPPEEREQEKSSDVLHDWIKARLADLVTVAETYRRDRGREAPRTTAGDVKDILGDAEEETCCSGGHLTLEMPCRNPQYEGCPHRIRERARRRERERELFEGYSWERTRGYER